MTDRSEQAEASKAPNAEKASLAAADKATAPEPVTGWAVLHSVLATAEKMSWSELGSLVFGGNKSTAPAETSLPDLSVVESDKSRSNKSR